MLRAGAYQPEDLAARSDGSVVWIDRRDESLVDIDLHTGASSRRRPLLTAWCALLPSGRVVHLQCDTADAGSLIVAEAAEGGWTVLRRDPSGHPPGESVCDDTSARWLVAAPCLPTDTIDPRRVCSYGADGSPHEVSLAVDGVPVAMHDGTALLIEPAPWGDHTRGALVHDETVTRIELPVGAEGARSARWVGTTLSLWNHLSEGGLELVRGRRAADGTWQWTHTAAPEGTHWGLHGPESIELAIDASGDSVWVSEEGGVFTRVPMEEGIVDAGEDAGAENVSPPYCVGRLCHVRDGYDLVW